MQVQLLSHLSAQLEYSIQVLAPESYSQSLPLLQNASVGKHIRHLLEIFIAFCEGMEQEEICYDTRKRDTRIEQEPDFALAKWQQIKEQIANTNLGKKVKVKANFSLDTTQCLVLDSSLEREFIYALDHAIHHLAIIKMALVHHFELSVPHELGVAPSTLRYEREEKLS